MAVPPGLFLAIRRAIQLGALSPSSSGAAAVMRLGLKAPAAPFSSSARDAPPRAAQPQFPVPPIVPNPSGPVGYVFDIDGVLIRGPKVLPAAQRAMQSVCGQPATLGGGRRPTGASWGPAGAGARL